MGNEAWTEALEWPGAKSFHSASQHNFKVASTGKVGGVYKGAEGLTFLRVTVSTNIFSNN
jgi:cathepsin A (carboxypeptidase C)